MRTTIDIRDDQRARLLEIAARRGEKGFSGLVQEALDLFLDEVAKAEDRIQAALGVVGSLGDEEAAHMEEAMAEIRGSWR